MADPTPSRRSITEPPTGIVLAGGASRRMGRDKRGLLVEGRPMLERSVAALAEVAAPVMVVERANRPIDRSWLRGNAARIVRDHRPDGPLAGLEAGLEAVSGEWAIVVGADMPWLDTGVLRLLADAAAMADPETDAVALESSPGRLEPLLAAYRARTLAEVRRRLDAGRYRMGDLLAALRVEVIEVARWRALDPDGRSVANVNAPEDLP